MVSSHYEFQRGVNKPQHLWNLYYSVSESNQPNECGSKSKFENDKEKLELKRIATMNNTYNNHHKDMLQAKLEYEKKKYQLDLDRQKIENEMLQVKVGQIFIIISFLGDTFSVRSMFTFIKFLPSWTDSICLWKIWWISKLQKDLFHQFMREETLWMWTLL